MACDRCWRLKARCVFDPAQDEDCAQCRKQNAECTWTRTKKPTPAPDKGYVLYLEERAKEIEQRLKQVEVIKVLPGVNIKREIDSLLGSSRDVEYEYHSSASENATTSQTSISRARDSLTLPFGHSPRLLNAPFASRLLQALRLTDVAPAPPTVHSDYGIDGTWKSGLHDTLPQYYGPSSVETLVQDAESYLSRDISGGAHFRSEFWHASNAENRAYANNDSSILASLLEDIPPEDLLLVLVDGYFERVNPIFPILHRPLFESQLRERLYHNDEDFTRLLLMVCAMGARWCQDPRVLDEKWSSKLSAGYRWFKGAYRGGVNAVYRPSLVNAQFLLLSLAFLIGSPLHDLTWLFAAKVSRIFGALGAHQRRKSRTLADELLKRSFMCYFILDRFISTALGRPSAFQNADMDLDDVMEIDDLSWAPKPNAPPPSQDIDGCLQFVTLNHGYRLAIIIGQALQTVFAPGDVKVRIGLGSSQGEEWMVRNLNQRLNRWAASTPVNWHPTPDLFLKVTIWAAYCYAVIYINRPFITSKIPQIAATSFHNCRQAARQCAQMVNAYYEIPTAIPLQCSIPGLFSSAMILIIDLIAYSHAEHAGPGEGTILNRPDYSAAENERDIGRCSAALGRLEDYLPIAGRLNDVMREFQAFWSSRLSESAQAITATGSTQPSEGPSAPDPYTDVSISLESLESMELYAQQPLSISTLAPRQNTSAESDSTPDFTSLFEVAIRELPLSGSQTQLPESTPVETGLNVSLNLPHNNETLLEEWVLNLDDAMAPGSAAFDLALLPPELGNSSSDWNDTMESALRLNEGQS